LRICSVEGFQNIEIAGKRKRIPALRPRRRPGACRGGESHSVKGPAGGRLGKGWRRGPVLAMNERNEDQRRANRLMKVTTAYLKRVSELGFNLLEKRSVLAGVSRRAWFQGDADSRAQVTCLSRTPPQPLRVDFFVAQRGVVPIMRSAKQ